MAPFTNTAVFQYRNFFASPESGGVGGGGRLKYVCQTGVYCGSNMYVVVTLSHTTCKTIRILGTNQSLMSG